MPLRTNLGREVTRGTLCRDQWRATVSLWCADVLPAGQPTPLLVTIAWRADDPNLPPQPQGAGVTLTLRKRAQSALSDARFDAPGGPAEKTFPGSVTDAVVLIHATTSGPRPSTPELELALSVDGRELAVLDLTVAAADPGLTVMGANGTDAPPAVLGSGTPARVRAVPFAPGGQLRWVSATPAVEIQGDPTRETVEVLARIPAGGDIPELRVWALSAPAAGPVVAASHVFLPAARVAVRMRTAGDPPPFLLGWIYWRAAGRTVTLRTDNQHGHLLALREGGDARKPWDYTVAFDWQAGGEVEVAYSRGQLPLPEAVLTERAAAFTRLPLPAPVHTAEGLRITIDVTEIPLTLTRPAELTLWLLTTETPTDAWHTEGLAQGAALWAGTNMTVTEGGNAPALPAAAAARPRERGLRVEGTVDGAATAVRLRVLNAAGAVLQLRRGIEPGAATANEITATLAPPAAGTRAFAANVFFADSAAAAGPVQLVALADGLPAQRTESAAVHLCRAQIALVDDHVANANGQTAGPVRGEADEKIDIDFRASPQNTVADITAQARARRMVRYEIAVERRTVATVANLPAPQMPMWMAELQLVGLSWAHFQELMARIHYRLNAPVVGAQPTPGVLRLDLDWAMTLEWDGPDINSAGVAPAPSRPAQHYAYTLALPPAAQAVTFRFRDGGQLLRADTGEDLQPDAAGAVPDLLIPAPVRIGYPVADRRLPRVLVNGQTRPWGRVAGAPLRDAVVIEFQPRVEVNGAEAIRGGDGTLELALRVDGQPADPGVARGPGGTLVVPPAGPLIRLPRFRVRGTNPTPHNAVTALVNALVEEFWNANNRVHVRFLTVAQWQAVAAGTFETENIGDAQFDTRAAGRRGNDLRTIFWGGENGMPLFGWPHGYGFGQLDSLGNPARGANDEEVWSFVENIRSALNLMMESKASGAYTALIQPHLPYPDMNRARAVFQREVVRRYNGGREFSWDGHNWVIDPTLARTIGAGETLQANPRLPYPNHVLNTHIQYWTGPNNAPVFNWPIAFTAANYGPGI